VIFAAPYETFLREYVSFGYLKGFLMQDSRLNNSAHLQRVLHLSLLYFAAPKIVDGIKSNYSETRLRKTRLRKFPA
jgi:hypothetical protein